MELRAFWTVLMRWRWVVLAVTGAAVIASGILIIAASLSLLFWEKVPVGVP